MDKINTKRHAQAERGRAVVKDRRRVKYTTVPTGETKTANATQLIRSVYPAQVKKYDPKKTTEAILKDGVHNAKIGGQVLVGALHGAKILTLSLEERATCPVSCVHWRTCYGNNMQQARRWAYNEKLLHGIADEIKHWCAVERDVLVRLHVLGDFPNVDYVDFWAGLLAKHKNLHVFGFTAHTADTEIGTYIAQVRETCEQLDRTFAVRHSNTSGAWGSFTLDYPTERTKIGDAVVCPEQRDAMNGTGRAKHCGSCALCWQSDVPVVFVEH